MIQFKLIVGEAELRIFRRGNEVEMKASLPSCGYECPTFIFGRTLRIYKSAGLVDIEVDEATFSAIEAAEKEVKAAIAASPRVLRTDTPSTKYEGVESFWDKH